jgi:xylulokinase
MTHERLAMIIAHDLGTTGNKATLVEPTGAVIGVATAAYPTDFGSGGKAEQDPAQWWAAVCSATRDLLQQTGTAPSGVDVVCLSGQMMGVVLLDGSGSPVRPAIIWADTRSSSQCRLLVERIGMSEAYRTTGHRLNPTYSLSKVMWVRDHEPHAFQRSTVAVQAKDYVVYRLSGVLATDPSDASSTNAYDQRAGAWSEPLLQAAGLPSSFFPQVLASTTVVGAVTADAAAQTGLLTGTPVVMGGGDGPMGALGAGIVSPESGAYTYLGSSSWISVAAEAPLHDPQMRSMTFNHVIPGQYVPTATMQAGGASLEWVIDTLAPGQPDRFSRLLAAAAEVEAAQDGLYFLPHLLGERSPYWNPAARAVFAGLARHHGPPHLTRAVVEGVAFNLYTGLKGLTENGVSIEAVDAIGGGARSDVVLRTLADVWGVPVTRRGLIDEATAIGAAIVGGVGVGVFDDFQVADRFSSRLSTHHVDREKHASYQREYRLFLEAYQRLEPWFDKI